MIILRDGLLRTIGTNPLAKPAFTLVEVLLSLAIFMMVMMPLLNLQGLLVTQAAKYARNLQRLISAESFMFENRILARYGKAPTATKKIDSMATTLSYQTKDLNKDLANTFKGVKMEVTTIEWKEKNKKRIERLISFVPAAAQEKSP